MNREEALRLIEKQVKNRNSIKHMLATEAVMRFLARRFNKNEELWGLTGLLHDIDIELVDYTSNPEEHGKEGALFLEKEGVESEIVEAVKAHNPATGKKAETLMEKAIYCADPLTGLIVAATLVLPSKKISDLTISSVINRYKEKSFARAVNRGIIASCSEMDISLDEFIEIGLKAMQKIAEDLEL